MRTRPYLKAWLIILAVLVVGGGALVAARQSMATTTTPLWSETQPPLTASPTPWVPVAKADTAAVVNISTTQVTKNPMALEGQDPQAGPFGDFFRQFFRDMPRTLRTHSLGSGFLIRADGYVVTNNHVVDGATEITVKLSDGRKFPAKVIGRDKKTDLALLKINASGLPTVAFGDSEALQVGEPVMAIGNPFGLEGTVTTGIVSAKGRVIGEGPYDSFIQTDASINPGNSGGPLVNASGQVVGIDTAIYSSQGGGSVGIGFAIPINLAKTILPQLEARGQVTRGWLGVNIQPVTPDLAKAMQLPKMEGALVAQVLPDSPAITAGVQAGDVIVAFAGHAIVKAGDLPGLVAATPIGTTASFQVLRDGKPVTLTATITELSEPAQLAEATPTREDLGLTVQPLTPSLARQLGVPDKAGLVVAGVTEGSPAAEAGIQQGDVLVQVNRKGVRNLAELRQALAAQKAGAPTLVQLRRKDASLFVAIAASDTSKG
jgi:serine protease Do